MGMADRRLAFKAWYIQVLAEDSVFNNQSFLSVIFKNERITAINSSKDTGVSLRIGTLLKSVILRKGERRRENLTCFSFLYYMIISFSH